MVDDLSVHDQLRLPHKVVQCSAPAIREPHQDGLIVALPLALPACSIDVNAEGLPIIQRLFAQHRGGRLVLHGAGMDLSELLVGEALSGDGMCGHCAVDDDHLDD